MACHNSEYHHRILVIISFIETQMITSQLGLFLFRKMKKLKFLLICNLLIFPLMAKVNSEYE